MDNTLKILMFAVVILIIMASFSSVTLHQIAPDTNVSIYGGKRTSLSNVTLHSIFLNIPAVDNEGNGVVSKLVVEEKPGTGGVLVDINQLLFWVDTQNSIRIAQRVAQNITNIDLSNVDLIYSIDTNASVIGGPSAGAAITISTIALLENRTLNPDVMITGTINPNGDIGPVGGIVEKAKAAKDVGATLFLLPSGQAVQTYYTPVEHCDNIGPITYCSTEYKEEKIDAQKEAGIEIKEVSNINEALSYFLT